MMTAGGQLTGRRHREGPVQRWTTPRVVALCAAVAAVVSLTTTLVVLRVTADDAVALPAVGVPTGVTSPVTAASGAGLDLPALFGQVSDGVVRIETTACVLGGAGTGFLVAPDLVVTAAHVVEGAHAILLRRDDGTEAEARVVGLDSVHDVALVRSSRRLDGHVFRFAAAEPAVGSDVAALGYPLDGPLVPVRRTVTGTGQSLDVSGPAASAGPDQVVRDLIRVDGGFEGGDSGGPLLAADGAVVGFVEGRSLADKNTGYAVSALQAAPLVARWRRLTTTVDVADVCDAPVGPPQSRVVVRDASGPGPGAVVADFYGTYASAINSGRYAEAWGLLTANARAGQTLEQWSAAERSSQIFDVAVRQVSVVAPGADPTTAAASPSPPAAASSPPRTPGATTSPVTPAPPVVTPGEGGALRAVVDFSSTQEDRLGPGGQTCSRWRVTYTLLRADGQWRIDRTLLAQGYPQPC